MEVSKGTREKNEMMDKARGCMIGGAAGDALGYPVEFMFEDEILKRYGREGITKHHTYNGLALISDDTQMSLFTADALINGDGLYVENIYGRYLDWLATQSVRSVRRGGSKLLEIPALFSLRAPGNTCISALRSGYMGTIDKPLNDSKGCGGIMRVAPVGIVFSDSNEAAQIGAESAAITHGHELGWIPSAMMAMIISKIIHEGMSIDEAVSSSLEEIRLKFIGRKYMDQFVSLIERSMELAWSDVEDLDAIHELGEGWVAEETLAIAVFCSMKYSQDFRRAVATAVNHNGDSDSTGAVTGNIVGAYVGIDSIPEDLVEDLELKDLILGIADELVDNVR